ncbi:SMI1/KNR4 family protein [Pseudomonas wadenswilerensis]
MNWPEEIVKLVIVKQALAEVDSASLFPFYLPGVAAGESSISAVEKNFEKALDSKYAGFLRYANGWRGFFQTVDLFGTDDLLGSEKMLAAQEMLTYIDDSVIFSAGFSRRELLPIAASASDKDLFVIAKPDSASPGEVLWLAGDLVDRFEDFDEFFLSMVDYNRADVDFLRENSQT